MLRTRALMLVMVMLAGTVSTGCVSGDLRYGPGRYESVHSAYAQKWRAHLGRPEPDEARIAARVAPYLRGHRASAEPGSPTTVGRVLVGVLWVAFEVTFGVLRLVGEILGSFR